MRNLIWVVLLFGGRLLGQAPQAEIKKLIADKQVLWLSEVYLELEDLGTLHEGPSQLNSVRGPVRHINAPQPPTQSTTTLKRESELPENNWDTWLARQIFDVKAPKYKDADLAMQLNEKEALKLAYKTDTSLTLNPETFEQTILVTQNERDPKSVGYYKLRLLVYYHAVRGLETRAIAIAPMEVLKTGTFVDGTRPLCWLPVEQKEGLISPKASPNVPLIRAVRVDMPFADCKVLKEGAGRAAMFAEFKAKIEKDKDKVFATASDERGAAALTAKEIMASFDRKDTTEVFDPETFEAKLEVTSTTFGDKTAEMLQLHNFIGWDEQRRQFVCSPYSQAILVKSSNPDAGFAGRKVLFYLYPHKRER